MICESKKCVKIALNTTYEALRDEGYDCSPYVVDVSDREMVYEVAKRVKEEVGKVNILCNNAGIVTCRTFLDLPDKAIEQTYAVNILSHYWVNINCHYINYYLVE